MFQQVIQSDNFNPEIIIVYFAKRVEHSTTFKFTSLERTEINQLPFKWGIV